MTVSVGDKKKGPIGESVVFGLESNGACKVDYPKYKWLYCANAGTTYYDNNMHVKARWSFERPKGNRAKGPIKDGELVYVKNAYWKKAGLTSPDGDYLECSSSKPALWYVRVV